MKQGTKMILASLTIIVLSAVIMTITLAFSSASLNKPLFESYFQQPMLLLMNFIPIVLLMSILYILSNRLWVGFSVTSLVFVTMSIVNKLKLTYRDDPFSFIDMKLVGESLEMSKRYDLSLNSKTIMMLVGLVGIAIILKMFFNFKIESKKFRASILGVMIILTIVIFNSFYFNTTVYADLGEKSLINEWVESQQFQSKGFIYPFIYSIKDTQARKLEGYNEEKAKEDLAKYIYQDIPQGKKVNVISIMLESYNDFSKFEDVELKIDVYENFHKLQEEAIHGNLITNVFAGGTINTERGFLTGYNSHPEYLSKTNAYPWYFKEQGYRTEAMHPITGAFYNRRNENEYIGFDQYDHFDNKYNEVQETPLMDMRFFDFIIEGFENSKKNKVPYFNFSVTYQNHGPYSDKKHNDIQHLVKKDHYNDEDYNIINNYLEGINRTDLALKKLFDYFRDEEEPTIIVIFGDHNPWLGKDNSVYNMLDINLDLGEVEGFKNYYETPYLIWGNEGAKEVTGKELVGEGRSISPNILMSEVFDYLDWEGNEYVQFIGDMKKSIDVTNDIYFKENGEYAQNLSEENKKLWINFRNVEYYYSYNFKKENSRNR